MTAAKPRWIWYLLACLLAAGLLWTHRFEYAACDTDGCVAIDRWTGSITFRSSDLVEEPAPDGFQVRAPVRRSPGRDVHLVQGAPGSRGRASAR